jgi:hypothetical protein
VRYSVVTPTILRESLIRCCKSVDLQTSKDWEHIVVIDHRSPFYHVEQHPQRTFIWCAGEHKDWGNTCRRSVYPLLRGDYVYYLDDDNWLANENALRDLECVTAPWALFPIFLHAYPFFHDPPSLGHVDSGNVLIKREFAQWPESQKYEADFELVESLLKSQPYQSFPSMNPVMVKPQP